MDIKKFFEGAEDKGLITAGKIEETHQFLKAADDRFEVYTSMDYSKLKKKLLSDGSIDPVQISKIHVTEFVGGKEYRRPIIDLVQQGGGMYGIALLGYTYIMEKVGIRFFSHGGTSAGAINATFLAGISNRIYSKNSIFFKSENRQGTKSEILTHIIINTDFSSFMERKGLVGKLQRMLFKKFGKFPLSRIFGLLAVTIGILLVATYSLFGLIYNSSNGFSGFELRFYDFFIGTLNVFAVAILFYVFFIRILGNRFGLNEGQVFYDWCDGLLQLLDVNRTDSLMERMAETGFKEKEMKGSPRLVLMTSNLTHNRIVKFPERALDYWHNPGNIRPAAYLRASMSLPLIFKVFIPSITDFMDKELSNGIVKEARFVDGGMLSNFPIREFHRDDKELPRFPTFGVLLSKLRDGKDGKNKLENTTLIKFVGSFLKTFRYFYDKDFINSSKEIESRVVTVDTKDYNWLDFWMDKATKKELFLKGVDAAIQQLEQFDWETYIKIREEELQEIRKMKVS